MTEPIINFIFLQIKIPLQNPILVFSLILFIMLLSPIILRKLNIPGIIGLIISGIIIGPFGINLVAKNSAIELFSTIGLIYIMFIAGLELDLNEFKFNRNKSLIFGILTFLIPFLIGFPVCYFLLGFSFNTSFLTSSIYSTHTLIAYPIVSKLGVSKNQAVAVTIGGTILTDTAVLIILAIILKNHQGSLNQDFWIRISISLVIFSLIMFIIIPRITKWFFQKIESDKYEHYIFVLFLVFIASFMAEVAGIEPIIGAFVAGLVLNRFIPHSSVLMNRIEFIGNSLFIPFFLISVGMLVDVRVILKGPMALIIAGIFITVALLGKWLSAFITQLIFKYSNAQRQLIYGLSSARVAATLAVVLVGFNAGIVNENILNGTILLILVTSIVSSFVTEKAAKKILISEHDDDSGAGLRSRMNDEHILVPVANQANLNKLLDFSLLIKDKKSPNPITVLSVVPNNHEVESNILKSRKNLDEFVRQGAASEVQVNPVTTIDQNPADGIERISKEIVADIIIIGWPNRPGFFDKLLGERVVSIINKVDKNLLICYLEKPLISHKRLMLISPALTEKEYGFVSWLQIITRISKELTIPIVHYGDARTQESILAFIRLRKLNLTIRFVPFSQWDHYHILAGEIEENDLIIQISARKGSISFSSKLENIPSRLEKQFVKNNKIVIYPRPYAKDHLFESYEDFSASPIQRGIETFIRLKNQFGKIIGRKDSD
jgi:Kef-type K+ transport system membrane component KefB